MPLAIGVLLPVAIGKERKGKEREGKYTHTRGKKNTHWGLLSSQPVGHVRDMAPFFTLDGIDFYLPLN